ncbi:MAG: hypothetical protein ABI693_07495 [Bryobacteraceae bacterium]
MHQPIQEGLEDYLGGRTSSPYFKKLAEHLTACPSCREEVTLLEAHAHLLRSLRAAETPEPRAGFYGRVLNRIEADTRPSFWADFLEPAFARRLLYSSALLLLLLGGYLASVEGPHTGSFDSAPEVILATDEKSPDFGVNPEQDRDKVLVTLTAYSE